MSSKLRNDSTTAELEKQLLEKGYVKVHWKQWNDGETLKSDVKLYLPGSNELKAAVAEAIANWTNMMGQCTIVSIDLNAKRGTILEINNHDSDEYEIWKIVK